MSSFSLLEESYIHCTVSYTWKVSAWNSRSGKLRRGGGGGLLTLSLIILGGGDKSSFSELSAELGDLDRHLREQEDRPLDRCMSFDLCTFYYPSELQDGSVRTWNSSFSQFLL